MPSAEYAELMGSHGLYAGRLRSARTTPVGSLQNENPEAHAARWNAPFQHPISLLTEIPLPASTATTHISHPASQPPRPMSHSQHSEPPSEDSRLDVQLSQGVLDLLALATGLQKQLDSYIQSKWRKQPLLFEQLYFVNGNRVVGLPEGVKFSSFTCAVCFKTLKIGARVQCQAVLDHLVSRSHVGKTLVAGGLDDDNNGHESWFNDNVQTATRPSRNSNRSGDPKRNSKRKRKNTIREETAPATKPQLNPAELQSFLESLCASGTIAAEHLNGLSAPGNLSIPLAHVAEWMARFPRVTLGMNPTTH